MKFKITAFSFTADEQPICDQNPGKSMFISYDGTVSPCINLALGGPSEFLGSPVHFPTIRYGNVLENNIDNLWESKTCLSYRIRFQNRDKIYGNVLA